MANEKWTEFTENTDPQSTDITTIVDNPGGSPLNQKITLGNLKLLFNDISTDVIWDAAGDIVQGTGANTAAKLAIGTAYQIPRVNSGATALEYVSAGRVLISEQTPTGTGTVTWDSIPAIYKSLEIEYLARSTESSGNTLVNMYYNNDTTATNYRRTANQVYGAGTTSSVGAATAIITQITGGTGLANCAGSGLIKIVNYANTTFYKEAYSISSMRQDDSSIYEWVQNFGHSWENTAAITRVDLVLVAGNYATGSTLRLYGVF